MLVTQQDLPPLGDGGGSVEVDQLVDGVELLLPQEVLPRSLSKHFEVLHLVAITGGEDPIPQTCPHLWSQVLFWGDLESKEAKILGAILAAEYGIQGMGARQGHFLAV